MKFMATLDDLRTTVLNDERSHATIAREAGIHPKAFSAFMNRRRGLSIETIERLTAALGLTVKLVRERKTK